MSVAGKLSKVLPNRHTAGVQPHRSLAKGSPRHRVPPCAKSVAARTNEVSSGLLMLAHSLGGRAGVRQDVGGDAAGGNSDQIGLRFKPGIKPGVTRRFFFSVKKRTIVRLQMRINITLEQIA
jgi:hypothetical protein